MDISVKRAVISVSNKEGIVEFAKGLRDFGVEIISTGGTATLLKKEGVEVVSISDYTGSPEILDGRVKTLHPKIHGGILACKENRTHMEVIEKEGIGCIDMVVVNLYPFEETVNKGSSFEDAIENIDIGGPAMLRAGAKNFSSVAVVVDPADYSKILDEMKMKSGQISPKTRFEFSKKTFHHTAKYDGAISNYLGSLAEDGSKNAFSDTMNFQFRKVQDLRYGENPHQGAAFYREERAKESSIANARQLQGKDLSFNNILDLHAASELVKEFIDPAVAIIKHNNPCGAAISREDLKTAYTRSLSCDPLSAFGGIVGVNRTIDRETALEMSKIFLEAIIAPGFDEGALEVLSKKKNLRLLEKPETRDRKEEASGYDLKRVSGGILVQTKDTASAGDLKVVTERAPTEEELEALLFAWRVVKHIKSNAIVFANGSQVLGVGAGQMSRIDSVKIAITKAGDAGLSLKGSAMASDAFFPFRDCIDLAAAAGIAAIIEPGGSINDEKVIEAVDEHKLTMVFTGIRHFRH